MCNDAMKERQSSTALCRSRANCQRDFGDQRMESTGGQFHRGDEINEQGSIE